MPGYFPWFPMAYLIIARVSHVTPEMTAGFAFCGIISNFSLIWDPRGSSGSSSWCSRIAEYGWVSIICRFL